MMQRHWAKLTATAGLAAVLTLGGSIGLTKEAPDTVPTYSFSGAFLAARAAEAENDLTSAIAYYRRALSFDPDNQDLQQSLLLILVASGSFDEALPFAEKLKEVPEVERFSRLALAVDAFRKEDFRQAGKWLDLVMESDLDRLITGVMTGWARAGEGDTKAALDHLDSLEGPSWYGLFVDYHKALIAAYGERDDLAKQAFDSVLENVAAGSGGPDTYLRAAEAYATYLANRDETERALSVLDKADEFVSGRAPIAALREKIESGKDVGAFVSSAAGGASEVLFNLALALNRGGSESFVRLYLHYALALNPDSDAILIQLGSVAEQQNAPERAIALYDKVSEESPLKRAAELQVGLNLADLDRHDEAIKHLKSALERDPDDMRAYLALGGVYASQENFAASTALYDRAVARIGEPRREHWNIFYQRGIAYERLKEWEKAEPNFHKALDLYPNQPQVLNYLGYSWVDMNMNLEEGLELIRTAVDLRPSDGYIVDSLGWAYYRLGRYEDAVRELERAVSLKPDDPVLNDHLGDAYWRVGRRLEAKFQWAHARDLDPEPDVLAEVRRKLEDGLPTEDEVKVAEAPSAAAGAGATMNDVVPMEEPAAEAEAEDATYVVRPGQTLWSIAVDVFGDGDRYEDILDANPGLRGNPNLIRPGQELRLPPAGD